MDLQEFVRNDSLFDSRLLLPNVWGGQGNNQSFRFLTPFFRVNGFMGKQTLISEIVTFDMDDFGTYLSSLPEDTHMIRHDTTQNLFSALYPFFIMNYFRMIPADSSLSGMNSCDCFLSARSAGHARIRTVPLSQGSFKRMKRCF